MRIGHHVATPADGSHRTRVSHPMAPQQSTPAAAAAGQAASAESQDGLVVVGLLVPDEPGSDASGQLLQEQGGRAAAM